MAGLNVFASHKQATLRGGQPGVRLRNCVFISHKREDLDMACAVAEQLMAFEIDTWLDTDELGFPEPRSAEEHRRLTLAIEAGLAACTHLLALITVNTKGSWWVPFEIGTCRAKRKPLACLLHKDVQDVPSYFSVGTGLETKHEFYKWAAGLSYDRVNVDHRTEVAALKRSPLDPYVRFILKRDGSPA